MSGSLFEFVVGSENDGGTLKTFLRRTCGITARSMTLLKYGDGGIFRDGMTLRSNDTVHTGEIITICLPSETNEIRPVEGTPDILYEDDHLLIVNKPAAMPVHPTKIHQLDTLANIIAFYQRKRGEGYVFRALNRLDKDTSGCVVIAKDRLTYAMVRDSVRKTYIAVCEGILDTAGVIDAPIGLADGSKMKRTVRGDGAPAVTHYQPVTHGNGHTLLDIWLETGRTHQIRCHLSSVGHPLAGDDLYGGSMRYISRQALHCRTVSLLHPLTKEELRIETDIPDVFLQIIKEG